MKAAILLTLAILIGFSHASFGATITQVAAGVSHTVALMSDGTVWSWGWNKYGQLGDGTTTDSPIPVQVQGLSGITAVAGGGSHTIALKNDGTVWAWGSNDGGQLGNGTATNSSTPVQVQGITGVTAIAAGSAHTIALKSDGTVRAWGWNNYGQLGNGTTTSSSTPVQVQGLTAVTAIAGGDSHTIVLKSDGTVWAWGCNSDGQLGNGMLDYTAHSLPVQVLVLTGVTAVAGGGSHTIALKSDGTVWVWGRNEYGQLGNAGPSRYTPVQVQGLSGATAIAGGYGHTVALKSDGTVWAWGKNDSGQFGIGVASNNWPTPAQVQGLSGATAIAVGREHTIALKSDGTVWTWGKNNSGQLGNDTADHRSTPISVQGLTGVAATAAGGWHTIALKSDGSVWTWGYNGNGQLGNGTTASNSRTPAQVQGLSGVTAIAGGCFHTIALKSDGAAWAWGDNYYGQLGDGTNYNNSLAPVQVQGLSGVTAIAGGGSHTIALKSDGTVWTWGLNWDGQLGNGTSDHNAHPLPFQVQGLSGVTAIAGGYDYTVALKSDGTVWAWGKNNYGQLGNGTSGNTSSTPVQVQGLLGVTAIACGYEHTIALKSDGTAWAWGDNEYGQLGNGPYQSPTPLQVQGLSGVTAIACGYEHTVALKSDGTVWAWGKNDCGQLGNGTTTTNSPYGIPTPHQVQGLSGVTAIAGGGGHTIALKSDTTVRTWGGDQYGQLGDRYFPSNPLPGQVVDGMPPSILSAIAAPVLVAAGDSVHITVSAADFSGVSLRQRKWNHSHTDRSGHLGW